MKKVLCWIALAVISLPLMLIVNEGDTAWPNYIGLGYLIFLVLIVKIPCVGRTFEKIIDIIDIDFLNDERKND